MSKWAFSFDNERYYGGFDSKDDAIEEGVKDAELNGYDRLYIGEEIRDFTPFINVSSIIEEIQENACDHSEYADDYLEDVQDNHLIELETTLNNVLVEWMSKHNYNPTFFSVEEYEEYTIDLENDNELARVFYFYS